MAIREIHCCFLQFVFKERQTDSPVSPVHLMHKNLPLGKKELIYFQFLYSIPECSSGVFLVGFFVFFKVTSFVCLIMF